MQWPLSLHSFLKMKTPSSDEACSNTVNLARRHLTSKTSSCVIGHMVEITEAAMASSWDCDFKNVRVGSKENRDCKGKPHR